MEEKILSVRELQARDIAPLSDYWFSADPAYLQGMGVDLAKIPAQDQWQEMLEAQLAQGYEEKQSYCLIWEANGQAIGHTNVNKIIFGQEAFLHLHLWKQDFRQKGMGTALVKKSLPYFFTHLQLKTLYCEPYALNPAPNKTLEKVGFTYQKEYITTPGWINFEQPVCLWALTEETFRNL
ncbi:GNAT family N-acetyltransferase [Rufibacter soli]|jgi:RimJ/RimL family protein N-acetyltransferase